MSNEKLPMYHYGHVTIEELYLIKSRIESNRFDARKLLHVQMLKYAVQHGPDQFYNEHWELVDEFFPSFSSFANIVGYEGESKYVDSLIDEIEIGELKQNLDINIGEIITDEKAYMEYIRSR
jgi:hypothetical protein